MLALRLVRIEPSDRGVGVFIDALRLVPKSDVCVRGKADDAEEETGIGTPRNRRGRGPGTQGRIHRDNVGEVPSAAGAGSHLQRLLKRGLGRRRGEPCGIDE